MIIGIIRNSQNPHTEIAEEAKASAIETVIFPCNAQFDRRVVAAVRTFIETNDVDIVNCHGYKSNFYAFFAARNRVPLVTTNHNWLTSHWKLKIYCFLDSLWIRFFDRIIAVSEGVKQLMLTYHVPEKKIEVIDNGVDMSRFNGDGSAVRQVRAKLGIREGTQVIGTVGSLTHEKGQIYLLEAAAGVVRRHKDAVFLLAGEGPLRTALEEACLRLGIRDHVVFAGYRSDVPALYALMDVFVLPSIKEGLPMVLLEAMAAKKPVVATRVGAIPKVIDGENGLLVDAGDVRGLETSILQLLDDPAMSRAAAEAGYATIRNRFSSDSMGAKYYHIYNEVLHKEQCHGGTNGD